MSLFKRRQLLQSAAAIALPAVQLGGGGAWAREAEPALPAIGSRMALTPVSLLDGAVWLPATAEGKVLVVYWWASWCPFCAVQSPHIEALWREQKARGLEVLALSIDRQPAAALTYMKARGYSFPAGMLSPEVAKILPKPRGLPVVVVRGRDGKVVHAESGEMFPEDVEGLKKFL